jgi:hypothetical protein
LKRREGCFTAACRGAVHLRNSLYKQYEDTNGKQNQAFLTQFRPQAFFKQEKWKKAIEIL